ncbi:MAG: acyl-CoA dehydratase activase-related protein [Candidatus Avigastranaerophilus sp.]
MQQSRQKKIGIPRAISYYNNYPFYYGFFSTLGFEVILSDKTTTKLINDGCKYVVSDTCLPVKVYVGHVINLLDKGINTIFVPSIQSVAHKINNCTKVRGLPEIIRNVVNRPFKMIEPTLDKTENIGFKDFWFETARQLNITDKNLIKNAIAQGWEMYNNFTKMVKSGIPYSRAIENSINGIFENNPVELVKPLSVVIMAHGYNLFDDRISMKLIQKLEHMGVKSYTGLNVSREDAINSIHALNEIQYWANELDLTGAAAYYMLNKKIDGIIALSAFGCGPDSLMVDEIDYHAKIKGIPMIHLTIDEHTGEAGFITRIEAFVDMLTRKNRKQLQDEYGSKKLITPVKQKEEERVLTNSLA